MIGGRARRVRASCPAKARRRGRLVVALVGPVWLGLAGLVGCAHQRYDDSWAAGEYEGVSAAIDRRLAEDTIGEPPPTPGAIRWSTLDDANLALDRGIADIVLGQPREGRDWLAQAAAVLDERLDGLTQATGAVSSTLDERLKPYAGLPHEHVILRALLALIESAVGGPDAFAYANQVRVVERQLADLDLPPLATKPAEVYEPSPFAHYAAGVVLEALGSPDEARFAYEAAARALGVDPSGEAPAPIEELHPVIASALDPPPVVDPDTGLVHIFDLRAVAPALVQRKANATERALNLAAAAATALATDSIAPLIQFPLPVSAVEPPGPTSDPSRFPPILFEGDGLVMLRTLDMRIELGRYAERARVFELARGIARRVPKAVGLTAATEDDALAALALLLVTAGEGADTRTWSLLPATIDAARLRAPAGAYALSVAGETWTVPVAAGGATVVLVWRPSVQRTPTVLVGVLR